MPPLFRIHPLNPPLLDSWTILKHTNCQLGSVLFFVGCLWANSPYGSIKTNKHNNKPEAIMGKQTSYLISAGDGRIRRNACGLLPLTSILGILILIASQQNLSAETIPTLIEGDKVALEKASEPSTEVLLAHLLPTNSCPNTLKNLKFAMGQKLFLHEDFYTEANAKRFFGDYYRIDSIQIKQRLQEINLVALSNPEDAYWSLKKFKAHDYPWYPCFRTITVQRMVVRDKSEDRAGSFHYETVIRATPAAGIKPSFNIYAEQFISVFGLPWIMTPRDEDYSGCNIPHRLASGTISECSYKKRDEGKTVHLYGQKELHFKFKLQDYEWGAHLTTAYDGLIINFYFYTEEK